MDPVEPQKDKKRRVIGPVGQWLKKRADAKRTRDAAVAAARQAATASVGRLVASAVAAGFVGGAGGVVAAERTGLVDLSPAVEANAEIIAELDQSVTALEVDADELSRTIGDIDADLSELEDLLDATDTINDHEVQSLMGRVARTSGQVQALANSMTSQVVDIGQQVAAISVDLENVIANQNSLGASLEGVADRVSAVADQLADVEGVAQNALSEALSATSLANEALDDTAALAEDIAALADEVGALAAQVQENADAVAELRADVDDLEQRVAAEEAEPAVVENNYDDSEIRQVVPVAYVILPSVSNLSAGETEVASDTVAFTVTEDDGEVGSNGFIRFFYRFQFTPNFTNCGSIELQIDGQFRRSISANNSAGRTIGYAASMSLQPGEHTVGYIMRSNDQCLIIEPTFEIRSR